MKKEELSGFRPKANASEDISFALRHFDPTPVSAASAIDFLGEYNSTRIKDLHGLAEVKTPAGVSIKERYQKLSALDNKAVPNTTVAADFYKAFSDILSNEKVLKAAEKKYQAALAKLNKDQDTLSYPAYKARLNKIYKAYEKDLEEDRDGKKKEIEKLFQTRPADINTWFGLTSAPEQDTLKKELLDSLDTNHKKSLESANKVDKGIEGLDKEYAKNVQQLAQLSRLYNYPENRKFIIKAIRAVEKRDNISLLPANTTLSSGHAVNRKTLQHITVSDVYEQLKQEAIKQKESLGPLAFFKEEGLIIGDGVKLTCDPESDTTSFNIPGFRAKIKISSLIYFKLFDEWDLTFGQFRMSEDKLKTTLSAQLKFIKAMKDDVTFIISSANEKRALHLARIACEEALLAGFKEEDIKVTIKAEGITKEVSFKDIFKGKDRSEIDRRVQQEDQRRNNALSMNKLDQEKFKEQIPRRTPPPPPADKNEPENNDQPSP